LIKNSTYLFLNISTKYIKDTKQEGRKEGRAAKLSRDPRKGAHKV
jgi:hypothetical protein